MTAPLTVEEVRALYFDATALREPPYKLYRMDGGDNRWYFRPDTDRYYISNTSLIQATTPMPFPLLKWIMQNGLDSEIIKQERGAYGTWFHIQSVPILVDRTYDLEAMKASVELAAFSAGLNPQTCGWYSEAKNDILAMEQFVRDYEVTPLAVEVSLTHELGFAGTVDLLCEMTIGSGENGKILKNDRKNGKTRRVIAIIDWKSGHKGFYQSQEIQLHLCKMLVAENFPDLKVECLFNWSPKEWETKPGYNLKNQTEAKSARKIPHLLGAFFCEDKAGPTPLLVVKGIISPDKPLEKNFEFVDIRSRFAEEVKAAEGKPIEVPES